MRNLKISRQNVRMAEKSVPMPIIGPLTVDEAVARIELAEKDIAKGKGYDFEDVINEARHRAAKYESAVY